MQRMTSPVRRDSNPLSVGQQEGGQPYALTRSVSLENQHCATAARRGTDEHIGEEVLAAEQGHKTGGGREYAPCEEHTLGQGTVTTQILGDQRGEDCVVPEMSCVAGKERFSVLGVELLGGREGAVIGIGAWAIDEILAAMDQADVEGQPLDVEGHEGEGSPHQSGLFAGSQDIPAQ